MNIAAQQSSLQCAVCAYIVSVDLPRYSLPFSLKCRECDDDDENQIKHKFINDEYMGRFGAPFMPSPSVARNVF